MRANVAGEICKGSVGLTWDLRVLRGGKRDTVMKAWGGSAVRYKVGRASPETYTAIQKSKAPFWVNVNFSLCLSSGQK